MQKCYGKCEYCVYCGNKEKNIDCEDINKYCSNFECALEGTCRKECKEHDRAFLE